MGLSIKNDEAERLARELARETGESLTTAIRRALEERLARVEGRRTPADKLALARTVLRRVDTLPVLDARAPDEISATTSAASRERPTRPRRAARRAVSAALVPTRRRCSRRSSPSRSATPCSSLSPRPTRSPSRPAASSRPASSRTPGLGLKARPSSTACSEVFAVETTSFTADQATLALDAWQRFGKGRHPAGAEHRSTAAPTRSPATWGDRSSPSATISRAPTSRSCPCPSERGVSSGDVVLRLVALGLRHPALGVGRLALGLQLADQLARLRQALARDDHLAAAPPRPACRGRASPCSPSRAASPGCPPARASPSPSTPRRCLGSTAATAQVEMPSTSRLRQWQTASTLRPSGPMTKAA